MICAAVCAGAAASKSRPDPAAGAGRQQAVACTEPAADNSRQQSVARTEPVVSRQESALVASSGRDKGELACRLAAHARGSWTTSGLMLGLVLRATPLEQLWAHPGL